MKTINQTYTIKAPIQKVWDALVKTSIINEWSGTTAKMNDQVGTQFSLWNGDIHGTNLEVIPLKTLKQEWYANFETPSFVTFTLSENNGTTTVILLHENVPDESFEDLEEGWGTFYMEPLKKYVESA